MIEWKPYMLAFADSKIPLHLKVYYQFLRLLLVF